MEPNETSLSIAPIFIDGISGCSDFIDQVGIKYIELIPLHDFGGGVVVVVMRLVVLVPLVSCVNAVEVLGFTWTVFVVPPIHLDIGTIQPKI